MQTLTATANITAVKKRPRRSRGLAALCWVYLLAMAGLICYLRTRGDGAGLPTILLFCPRWIFAAPLILLLPSLIYRNCRLPFLLLTLTALFPLMGLCIGWHRFVPGGDAGQPLRIVTFNLHHIPLDGPAFKDFLANCHADILAFEEMPPRAKRHDFPAGLTHITWHGEVCLASRYPIRSVKLLVDDNIIRYTIETPSGPLDLIGLHLSSPHWALRDAIDGTEQGPEELARNITNRRDQAELLSGQIERSADHPLIIAGDFNLVPDSPLFTRNFSTMSDAFQTTGFGFGWTYFHQHTMVRIDHVLSNRFVTCKRCVVGPNLGSPHRPIVADLTIVK